MLISLGGLPGTGKTTIAREVARELTAVYLCVDWIEQSMRKNGWPVEGEGYCVAQAVAEDNLRLGRIVVADSVNPWPQSRADWRAVAERTRAAMLDVEVVCSDVQELRRRVTACRTDPTSHRVVTWQDVVDYDSRAEENARIVIDTARLTMEQCVSALLAEVPRGNLSSAVTCYGAIASRRQSLPSSTEGAFGRGDPANEQNVDHAIGEQPLQRGHQWRFRQPIG